MSKIKNTSVKYCFKKIKYVGIWKLKITVYLALNEFAKAFADLKIQNIDLAALIKDPDLVRQAFMNNTSADFVNDALAVIAGPDADKGFGELMQEVLEYATKSK